MYQVLYRKYRPKKFADVYGQDHVVSTLKNEIKEGRISHAYLFTGSRGTGKTTCAKILARAVNCENPSDGEPCNECEVCRGLEAGTIYDVVEIDAASNNGVDNIRDLREEANYTPSRGKYRVYIIDEAHMLSAGAFNALLKTLEEPPAHVIFILATTEVHKIPATILSRCQRFDFKRISPETMSVRLKQVASMEGVTVTDEAAMLIARIADGALRDGLSILDQCLGRSKNIDAKLVSQVAGLAGRDSLYQLSDCVLNRDSSAAIEIISTLYQNSYDMERLCVELIDHFRNLLVVKTVKNSRGLIVCADDEYNNLVNISKRFTLENLIFALDLFQNALAGIKSGTNSRIEMELSFVKLCDPKMDTSMDALLDRISALERAVRNGVAPAAASEAKKAADPAEKAYVVKDTAAKPSNAENPVAEKETVSYTPNKPEPGKVAATDKKAPDLPPAQEPADEGVSSFDHWDEFMDVLRKKDIALFGVLNGAGAHFDSGRFVIDSPNPTIKEFIKIPTHLKAIKMAVAEVTGRQYKIAVSKPKAQNSRKRDMLEDLINRAQNNVEIKFE